MRPTIEELLAEHLDVRSVAKEDAKLLGLFDDYRIQLRPVGTAFVMRVPNWWIGRMIEPNIRDGGYPWILLAANELHDLALVRLRIDTGVRAARRHWRDRVGIFE